MNILEILPSYDKVEIYPEYRTYTKESPYSDNDYDYEYDLYIIYFEKFVILRDYGRASFQEKPVVIPRVFFDKVHPLEDRLAKAKRFLEFKINNSHEQDLVKRGNWNIENINNNQNSEQLRKFLNLALGQDDHQSQSYSNDKRESISTLMEMLTTLNKFFTVFPCSEPKQKIIDLGRYFQEKYFQQEDSYIKELKNEEIVLTPKEFEEVYQDFLNRINHSDDGNKKDYEYSNDDDDAEFGYLAGLVADGELNPNDPRWPF
ncbi:hypothetical protein [Anabaena sp. AL09]|jgi:hypothetical protein|uniref:hypothetical protein n=1 Tax=Anabaena sp. AL09 TaxID=1710891 RepID=UPI000800147D|nr:hypothetical protein [Anabaena sp. AL09]OBQ05637.1 MAG: hypothetical protein AN490_13370 [Anabaena sp. AL09]OBQ13610.1 MAG: hypothetical protein AN482_04090 [Anabaena sp. LE011-02]